MKRRDWTQWAMFGGIVAAYGWFGSIAVRFLFPRERRPMSWQFLGELNGWPEGEARRYRAPTGETINVARQRAQGGVDDFIALGSTCPHLGCQVFWEPQNDRFFCPCHNGIFDPAGVGIGGPPGEAGQDLPHFDLKAEAGLLYIRVPEPELASNGASASRDRAKRNRRGLLTSDRSGRRARTHAHALERIDDAVAHDRHGPGHDPCLMQVRGARLDGASEPHA